MKKIKEFWKENSYDIVKMFINQIGMTIFGLIVAMATVSLSSKMELAKGERWPLLLGSVFGVLFYLFLLGYMTSEIGAKDGIRIEGKRMKFMPFKGLFMSLIANSVNLLLAVLAIVGKACVTNVSFFSSDSVTEAQPAFAAAVNSISELI